MEQSSVDRLAGQIVAIPRSDRWQAYRQLRSLEIPCCCDDRGCLQVEVNSPLAAIQVWSVMRQLTCPRRELAIWLDRCWCLKSNKNNI